MKTLILTLLVIVALLLVACQPQITSFQECVDAGYPIMESYPRQCAANGQTFVEEVEQQQELAMFTECPAQEEGLSYCTLEYNPVCGLVDNGVRCVTTPCPSVDAQTFSNSCGACANKATGHYEGTCQEQIFVICKETQTGFSAEEFAKNNNGICVDICPGNYDAYMTQIGVELCISHYGQEEIQEWQVCTESSNSCNCVKAYETTRGEEVDNAEYRCVPDQYAERLLFRGGQDRLDEQGQQSVAIA